jgi:hypothetical protein
MNVTPWVQRVAREGEFMQKEVLYSQNETGGEWTVSTDGGLTAKTILEVNITSYGIEFVRKKTLGGVATESFAWDEMTDWSYESPSWHTWSWCVLCNNFRFMGFNEKGNHFYYELFVRFSCMAHVLTTGRFPTMSKGVALGFLDPSERSSYDSNGFPSETMRGYLLRSR